MDRKDVDTAVAENTHLRGLYGVTAGLLAVVAALSNADRGPFAQGWFVGALAAVLALATLGVWVFYTRTFGRATPSSRDSRRMLLWIVIGVPVVIALSMLLSSKVPWSLDLPVNTSAIAIALVMLLAVGSTVGIRLHHALVYGALLVVGVLPVWERGGESGNTGLLLAGIALVVGGLLDHRLLVRRFGSSTSAGAV